MTNVSVYQLSLKSETSKNSGISTVKVDLSAKLTKVK